MGKFDGKVLLELGTNIASVDIVKYAKSEGAYVIVTDYLPTEESQAKQYADETAMISTMDVDAVTELACEKKIDGIFCGVSEAHLLTVHTVAKRLDLPCYFTMDQWRTLQNKQNFRESCQKYGIQVPRGYQENGEEIRFPLIVKPVDNGASCGITVCYEAGELKKAIDVAREHSQLKKVVIEEYIRKDEVMVYYTVMDGRIALSAMCDRIMKKFDRGVTQLPIGYRYPSKYLELYQNKFDSAVRSYIQKIGVKNGLLAFQAFIDESSFIPFDPTYRLDGTTAYHFVERENGVNVMKQLVDYQLTGKMGDPGVCLGRENPAFMTVYYELPILLSKGRISRIQGIDEVEGMDGIIHINMIRKVGDMLTEASDFKQILCRILFTAQTQEELDAKINEIKKTVLAFDENDKAMNLTY